MNPFKKKPPIPSDLSPPTNIGGGDTPTGPVYNPDLPGCPYLNVDHCPYTAETKDGCPYKQMVADKALNVPAYCPLIV